MLFYKSFLSTVNIAIALGDLSAYDGVSSLTQFQLQQWTVFEQQSRGTCHCPCPVIFHLCVMLIFCRRRLLGFGSQIFFLVFGNQRESVMINYHFWFGKYIFYES